MKLFKKIIIPAILLLAVIGAAAGYFCYGATLINPDDEQSIISHLSKDKDNPIDILKVEKYKNYATVLYTVPAEIEENPNAIHLDSLVKSKYYSDKYELSAKSGGNQTEEMVLFESFTDEGAENKRICFVANTAVSETKCSVFEVDPVNGAYVNRLDVIDVPENEPYIIVKEYQLESKDNLLMVYDGEIELSVLTEEL